MPESSTPIIEGFFREKGSEYFFRDNWPGHACEEHGDLNRLHPLFASPLLGDFETLAQHYRGPTFYFAGETGAMRPIDRPVVQLYRDGRTIYFGNVEPFVEGATGLLREFEKELGVNPGCARMGVFASPKNDGATTHYDTNEVFSIQLKGTKQFNIAPVKELSYPAGIQYSPGTPPQRFHFPQMQEGFPNPAGVEFESMDMRPGSVLFMPRGTWHYTSASADSIAVSIIVNPALAVDMILEHLKLSLLQKRNWREPVLGCWNSADMPDSSKEKFNRLIEELNSVTGNLSAESIVRSAGDQNIGLQKIDSNTRFQTMPTASMVFQGEGERIQVRIIVKDFSRGERQTGSITVNQPTKSMLDWILERRQPFTTQDLGNQFGIDNQEIYDLLRGLCASEVLMPLWYDEI